MTKAGIIREYLKKFPNIPTLTLARKLNNDHPDIFNNIESSRSAIRKIVGAFGKESCKDKTFHRPKGVAGTRLKLPPSREKSWTPFYVKRRGGILVLSDLHAPYHNKKALTAALNYGAEHNPQTIIINGDAIDFPALSRFQSDPRERRTKKDIDVLARILLLINELFPDADKIYKEGNHEERWTHYLWNVAPVFWDFEHLTLESAIALAMTGGKELKMPGWTFIGDQRPIMVGKIPILHGHELPKGMTNPVNPARGAFLRTIHAVLIGHGHRTSTHTEPDMFKREIVCWATGCLCGLWPHWARVNKWNHGFAYINYISPRNVDITNLRISLKGEIRTS